jgi:hypothetical protein
MRNLSYETSHNIRFLGKRYNIIHFSVIFSLYRNDFFTTLQIEPSWMFVFIPHVPNYRIAEIRSDKNILQRESKQ